MMGRITLRSILVSVLLVFCLQAQAEITSLSSAINKAGRQRMLSQRILKTYSMIGLDVNPLTAQEQRTKAIELFDTQLTELESYAPNKQVKAGLTMVRKLWGPYKQAVTGAVNRDNALKLFQQSGELLGACHQVVLLLQDLSTTNAGYLVNISGRQRMLSQRLSMLYMYRSWGFKNAEIRGQSLQLKNEFNSALSELTEASENTPELTSQLKKAATEWRLFQHGLDNVEKKPIPYIVNLAGDKLLNTMNDITALYADLEVVQAKN